MKKFYLLVFLAPLVMNPWGYSMFELPKQEWIYFVMGIFLMGVATKIWQKKGGKVKMKYAKPVAIYLGVLSISYLLSTVFSVGIWESILGNNGRFQGLAVHIAYLIHFVIMVSILDKKLLESVKKLTYVVGVIVGLYAILQKIGVDAFFYLDFFWSRRANSTFGNPNFLGQFMIFPIVMLAHEIWEKRKKGWDFFLLGCLLICGVALWASGSRAAILGAALGLALVLVLSEKNLRRRILWMALGAAGACGLVMWMGQGFAGSRSLVARMIVWQDTLKLLPEMPIWGYGLENSYQAIQEVLSTEVYRFENLFRIYDRLHNESLEIWVTRGWLGLVLYVVALGFVVKQLFVKKLSAPARMAVAAILGYMLAVQLSFSLAEHIIYLLLMWAILVQERFKMQKVAVKYGAAFLVLGVMLIAWAGINFRSDLAFEKAHARGDHNLFMEVFENELSYSEYYRVGIIFFWEVERIREDVLQMTQSYREVTNEDFRSLILSGRVEEDARKYFLMAEEKSPNYPLLWTDWGARAEGCDEKVAVLENLLRFSEGYADWPQDMQVNFNTYPSHGRFFEPLHELEACYIELGKEKEAQSLRETGLLDVDLEPFSWPEPTSY